MKNIILIYDKLLQFGEKQWKKCNVLNAQLTVQPMINPYWTKMEALILAKWNIWNKQNWKLKKSKGGAKRDILQLQTKFSICLLKLHKLLIACYSTNTNRESLQLKLYQKYLIFNVISLTLAFTAYHLITMKCDGRKSILQTYKLQNNSKILNNNLHYNSYTNYISNVLYTTNIEYRRYNYYCT